MHHSGRLNRIRLPRIAITLALSGCTLNIGSGTASTPSDQRESQAGTNTGDVSTPPNSVLEDATEITEAGRKYLEIVSEVNCLLEEIYAIEKANTQVDGTTDPAKLPDIQSLLRILAPARELAVRRLLDYDWPDTVSSEIDLIARDWSKVARSEVALSEAVNLAAFNRIHATYVSIVMTGNPGYVRSQLGLGAAEETNDC